MILAPVPIDDALRLRALHDLDILDTPREERFDRITRLACRLFDVPIALVSLVDADRQWFKSCVGLDVPGTPRDISFCAHAIVDREPFVIEDTMLDARFAGNPLVVGEPGIRFYPGCPLMVSGGYLVGTLCVIDTAPRTFTSDDVAALRDLAGLVEHELEAVHIAATDELTTLVNRRGFLTAAEERLAEGRPVTVIAIDLDGFKAINDGYGHAEGDRALTEFAGALKGAFRRSDVIARLGGDEFAVLLADADRRDAHAAISRLRRLLERRCTEAGLLYTLDHSVGIVEFDPDHHASLDDLLAEADRLMYRDKRAG